MKSHFGADADKMRTLARTVATVDKPRAKSDLDE
jgi:hypothetical protein